MVDPIRICSTFSGVGMLDEGVRAGLEYLGIPSVCVGYCEREAYPASVLMARMEEKTLEQAPVWCGDIADLDAKPLRGFVDLLTGGPPCQPYSVAGAQEGNDDDRAFGEDDDGPMQHLLRVISECGPALVFLENVPPWLTGGHFRAVGEELCRMGYSLARPLFITAKAVGASHKRDRVFVLAYRECSRWPAGLRRHEHAECESASGGTGLVNAESVNGRCGPGRRRGEPCDEREELAYRTGDGRKHGILQRAQRTGESDASGDGFADSECNGLVNADVQGLEIGERPGGNFRAQGSTWRTAKLPMFAPGRDRELWQRITEQFPWLAPAVESGVHGVADGMAIECNEFRNERLRATGNGVVPLQAAVAFVTLVEETICH